MNPIAARTAPQPLVGTTARLAVAAAALAILASATAFASRASHEAVTVAHSALNPAIVYVTLPAVEVLARREPGDSVAEAACANPQPRT